MHALKLIFLMIITLTVMRSVSWGIAWPWMRRRAAKRPAICLLSNAAAFLLFVVYLHLDRVPGESLDFSAAIFGAVVYAVFTAVDLIWVPWTRSAPKAKGNVL